MGSPAVAAWIAHVVFWTLLAYGAIVEELDIKRVGTFLILWAAGLVVLPYLPYPPARVMFSSFVAMLDIALVFTIFKGDVRLT
jgi:hypothetical protein